MEPKRILCLLVICGVLCAGCFGQRHQGSVADADVTGLNSGGDVVLNVDTSLESEPPDASEGVDGQVLADTTGLDGGADAADPGDLIADAKGGDSVVVLPSPDPCVLTLEQVATVPGYSYAASIDLDSQGRPHLTYSSNEGGFSGYYAYRKADGTWVKAQKIWPAARLFIALETNDVAAVIAYDGAFNTSLFRSDDGGLGWDPPLVVSPKEASRSLYDAVGLGGQSHLSLLLNGSDAALVRVDGSKVSSESVTPGVTSDLGRLVVNQERSRNALYYVGPSPSVGPMIADGLYRHEQGSSALVTTIPLGSSAIAPILDAHGSGLDQILYLQRDHETSLHLLTRLAGDSIDSRTFLSVESPPPCPLNRPGENVESCTETAERYSWAMDGLVGTGTINHFLVGRDHVTRTISYIEQKCYPCDPVGPGGEGCPPQPICETVPGPAHIAQEQVQTTLTLVRTPAADDTADPLAKSLWASGLQIYHIRGRRGADGVIHLLAVGKLATGPDPGEATGVFYLRVDPVLCFAGN